MGKDEDGIKTDLMVVGRATNDVGYNEFRVPEDEFRLKHQSRLHDFVSSFKEIVKEIHPIAENIVRDNTVVVMVVNLGQIDLLINFVCSARNRQLDIGNVFVFAVDKECYEITKKIGLTSYYDERVRIHHYGILKFWLHCILTIS